MELSETIEIAVGIILNNKGELLTVRKSSSTYYQLPGGKLEIGETPETTLLRELEEELGLCLANSDCSFLQIHEAQAVNEIGQTVRGFVFRCYPTGDLDALQAKAELAELRWIKTSEIGQVKLANLLRQVAIPVWLKSVGR